MRGNGATRTGGEGDFGRLSRLKWSHSCAQYAVIHSTQAAPPASPRISTWYKSAVPVGDQLLNQYTQIDTGNRRCRQTGPQSQRSQVATRP